MSQAASLPQLGQLIAQETGVSKVTFIKSGGKAHIEGQINPKDEQVKVPRIPVLRSRLQITDSASATEWTFMMIAPLDSGEEATLGYGVVPLDASRQPTTGPEFVLEKRFFVNGIEHRISVIDDATGQSLSLTSLAIDEAMKRFKARYPGGPDELPGSLADDNKANFRNEYLKAIDQGMTPDEAKVRAIEQISFGKQRMAHGYTVFQVDVSGEVEISYGDPPQQRRVPQNIRVIARKP